MFDVFCVFLAVSAAPLLVITLTKNKKIRGKFGSALPLKLRRE